jgi:hypothetical protein
VIEFVVDVEEPLGESAKFTAQLIFQLGLEQLEKVVGSSDTLANGSDVDPRGSCTCGEWKLGDGVEGGDALPSAVKFPLQVKLNHFHIAQGHADVPVSHHLHKRRQADAQAHHLSCEGVMTMHHEA